MSKAIVVWTGWVRRPGDDSRLVDEFGAELLTRVRELEEEFYASDARHTAASLEEMGELASVQFKSRHPEITEDAVEALARCCTFDNR